MTHPLTYDQWVRRAAATEAIPPNSDGLLHVGERAALIEQLSYLKKRNAQLMKQQRAVLLAACEAQAAHAQCADFAGQLMRDQATPRRERSQDSSEDLFVEEEEKGEVEPGLETKKKKGFLCVPTLRGPKKPSNGALGKSGGEFFTGRSAASQSSEADALLQMAQMRERLARLEHENGELMRKTSVLVDYVRQTAPLPQGHSAYPRRKGAEDEDLDEDDDDDDDDDDLPTKGSTRRQPGCLPEPSGFDSFANSNFPKCKWESFVSGVASAFSQQTPNLDST